MKKYFRLGKLFVVILDIIVKRLKAVTTTLNISSIMNNKLNSNTNIKNQGIKN